MNRQRKLLLSRRGSTQARPFNTPLSQNNPFSTMSLTPAPLVPPKRECLLDKPEVLDFDFHHPFSDFYGPRSEELVLCDVYPDTLIYIDPPVGKSGIPAHLIGEENVMIVTVTSSRTGLPKARLLPIPDCGAVCWLNQNLGVKFVIEGDIVTPIRVEIMNPYKRLMDYTTEMRDYRMGEIGEISETSPFSRNIRHVVPCRLCGLVIRTCVDFMYLGVYGLADLVLTRNDAVMHHFTTRPCSCSLLIANRFLGVTKKIFDMCS